MEILSLGEKIKRIRKDFNMTLKDLAGDRITPGQISLVESGKSNPSMDLLEYLADKLKVPVDYLMESEESQAEKICIFYGNISEACILDKELIQAEEFIEKSLYYAEKYNLEYRKAKNLFFRGLVKIERKEIGLAQQYFLSANSIFIRGGNHKDIVNTLLQLGIITLQLKAFNSSSGYFQQAEKVLIDNDIWDDFLIGEVYYYIAFTYLKLEEMDKAINYSFLAKQKFELVNDKKRYAESLLLLAKEYILSGDLNKAIKYSEKTLVLFRDMKDLEYVSQIENSLGKLFYDFENMEESFIHLNIAKDIRTRNKDQRLIETLISICENYIKLKDIEKAKALLNEILEQVENGEKDELLNYYLLKYKVDTLEDNYLEAENTLIAALNFARTIENLKTAAEISIMLGKFYLDAGKEKESAQYLYEGVELLKEQKIIK